MFIQVVTLYQEQIYLIVLLKTNKTNSISLSDSYLSK